MINQRARDLNRFYGILRDLERKLGGKRLLSACNGRLGWPERGVYFFFEPVETRRVRPEARVVRVGTHAVGRGSRTTLWNRLRTHRGGANGSGNHRGSIFRLHVGAAIAARNPAAGIASWGIGNSAPKHIRAGEEDLKRCVSEHIGAMSILWLTVTDEPGPDSDRAYLERNLIGLLAGGTEPPDPPSSEWLGLHSPHVEIRRSALWNLNYLDFRYDPRALEILEQYVQATTSRANLPTAAIPRLAGSGPKFWRFRG